MAPPAEAFAAGGGGGGSGCAERTGCATGTSVAQLNEKRRQKVMRSEGCKDTPHTLRKQSRASFQFSKGCTRCTNERVLPSARLIAGTTSVPWRRFGRRGAGVRRGRRHGGTAAEERGLALGAARRREPLAWGGQCGGRGRFGAAGGGGSVGLLAALAAEGGARLVAHLSETKQTAEWRSERGKQARQGGRAGGSGRKKQRRYCQKRSVDCAAWQL